MFCSVNVLLRAGAALAQPKSAGTATGVQGARSVRRCACSSVRVCVVLRNRNIYEQHYSAAFFWLQGTCSAAPLDMTTSAMSCERRCAVCQNLNTETDTFWVQQTHGTWWFPVCSACCARAESTIHPRVRQHYEDKLGGLVAERVAILAEMADALSPGAADRVQRRRLN